jgi:ACS family hexuronate transporter-like MFS transporter
MSISHVLIRGKPLSEPWKMLLCLLLAQLMVAFIGRSIGPLGVLIGEDLSLTKAQIGMLPAALFLGQALASIPVGFIVDQVGSRKLLLVISFSVSFSFLAMAFSHHFWLVLLLVVIGGFGYGSMHPVSNRGIIYWFALNQRGVAMGVKQTGITTGSAMAGLLLLPLGAEYGWRPVLAIACILLLVGGLFSYYFYKDPINQRKSVEQKKGLASFYVSMLKLMRNKPLMLVSISAMGLSGSQICLVTYLVLFSYEYLHISLFLSGILLVVSEISGSIGRVVWGLISDRLFNGKRVGILMLITTLSALSSLTIAFLPSHTSFWMMVPIIIVFGFAVSGYNGIWMNLASEVVPPEYSGISSGFSITLGSIGVIVFPPIFGFIVDSFGSFTAGWLSITALMVIVFALLIILTFQNKKIAH